MESPAADRSSIDETLAAVPSGDARTEALSRWVAEVYVAAALPVRARLLECLLKPLRPLALAAVAAGAFGAFLHRESWGRISVSIDDALRYSADQVFELARYVEQFQPDTFQAVERLLASNPACVNTLSGSLLLVALHRWLPKSQDR
jgi:hypothetical protein